MLLETGCEELNAVGHHHVEQRHGEQTPEVTLQQPGEHCLALCPLSGSDLHTGGVLPRPHIALSGGVRGEGEGGAPSYPDTILHH